MHARKGAPTTQTQILDFLDGNLSRPNKT